MPESELCGKERSSMVLLFLKSELSELGPEMSTVFRTVLCLLLKLVLEPPEESSGSSSLVVRGRTWGGRGGG